MSSSKSHIKDVIHRIIELSQIYPSAKEFLNKAEISNHSFITDLKKGRIKNPSLEYLLKIAHGTGCSWNWLMDGSGDMFKDNSDLVREKDLADPIRLRKLEMAADSIIKEGLEGEYLPLGLDLKLAKTLTLIIEHQNK